MCLFLKKIGFFYVFDSNLIYFHVLNFVLCFLILLKLIN